MKLKIPPPIILLSAMGLMIGIYLFTNEHFSYSFIYQALISKVLLYAGIFIIILGIFKFRSSDTTIDPMHPERANRLVSDGIYSFTRNPMYLGMVLVLLGGVVRTGNPLCLFGVALFMWYITKFQIIPEEEALKQAFGSEYTEYCKKVRRWI